MNQPLPPDRAAPPVRPLSVPDAMAAERAASGARPRVPISRRYGSGSRSPLPLLALLFVLLFGTIWARSVWQPDYREVADAEARQVELDSDREARGLDGSSPSVDKPGDVLARRAIGFANASEDAALPTVIVAESELDCWRAYEPVVSRAQRYQDANGTPAATLEDLGLPSGDSADDGLSGRVIDATPEFGVGCGLRAANLVLDEAQRQNADYDAWRFSVGGWRFTVAGVSFAPYAMMFVLWLATVAWLTRVLVNLRPSIGRNVGVGTAIASLTPVWIVPLYAFGFIGVQTDNLWLQRILIVLSMVVVAVYFLWTLARVASQVWVGTGLPLGGLSSMLWAPALLSIEFMLLGLLTYTFVEDRPVTTSASTTNSIPELFGAVALLLLLLALLGWVLYMLVVSVAQHIGIGRAIDGTEVQPTERRGPAPEVLADRLNPS